jgi:hypothetical protein
MTTGEIRAAIVESPADVAPESNPAAIDDRVPLQERA